jgi:hypothetical protein
LISEHRSSSKTIQSWPGLLEMVKAMESVRDAICSKVVDVVGMKRSIPSSVIDKLKSLLLEAPCSGV